MIRNKSDFIPLTYAVKGYRKRENTKIKRAAIYSFYIMVLLFVGTMVFLSMKHII